MTADFEQPPQPPPADGPRHRLAIVAIVLAILMTVAAVWVIGWRWYSVRFPNAALFVRGDAATADTEVAVSSEHGAPIYSGRLTEANDYQVVVLVEQGIYQVIARRDGKTLIRERLYVRNGGGLLLQVKPPATQPATGTTPPAASGPTAPETADDSNGD